MDAIHTILREVAPNTISVQRLHKKLGVKRSVLNAMLYSDPLTIRHIRTPTSHTDPHITWSLGTEPFDKTRRARKLVNSRNKKFRKTEKESDVHDGSD